MYNKTTDAQKKAISNWRKKNPERTKYNSYRSTSRTFIRKRAKMEDIEELRSLLNEREEQLK